MRPLSLCEKAERSEHLLGHQEQSNGLRNSSAARGNKEGATVEQGREKATVLERLRRPPKLFSRGFRRSRGPL